MHVYIPLSLNSKIKPQPIKNEAVVEDVFTF